jgi:prefoldin subunit 5
VIRVDSTMKNTIIAVALSAVFALSVAGCASTGIEQRDQIVAHLQTVESEIASLDEKIARVDAVIVSGNGFLDVLPPEWAEDVRAGVASPVQAIREYASWLTLNRDQLLDSTSRLREAIEQIDDGASASQVVGISIGEGSKVVSEYLPEPWKSMLAGAGALLAGAFGVRAHRKSTQLVEVVSSLESSKVDSDDETFTVDKDKARQNMSPSTRAAVASIKAKTA